MFLWRLDYFGASVWSCLSDSGELYGWEAARGVAVPIPERELPRLATAAQRLQPSSAIQRTNDQCQKAVAELILISTDCRQLPGPPVCYGPCEATMAPPQPSSF